MERNDGKKCKECAYKRMKMWSSVNVIEYAK
jgi:hypothetical protein